MTTVRVREPVDGGVAGNEGGVGGITGGSPGTDRAYDGTIGLSESCVAMGQLHSDIGPSLAIHDA